MIDIKDIDKVIYETISEYQVSNSYDYTTLILIRLFYKIYGKYGYYYYHREGLENKGIEMPISQSSRTGFFTKVLEHTKGLEKKVFSCSIILTDDYIFTADGYIICEQESISRIKNDIIKLIDVEDVPYFRYIVSSNMGITSRKVNIREIDCDINSNYNSDIPYKRINEVIRDDSSSLSILYGIPGSGKTFLIRKLISDNRDLQFYWLDSKMFAFVNDDSFISFLAEHSDSIFIIEDCEFLLQSREDGNNSLVTTLLNISDGLLGDALNIKFICTFNTELTNIDKALLRKGRLKVKYEFKELEEEKVKTLADKLGINIPEIKPMPLCDVYNYNEDNGNNPKEPLKRVGFLA